MSKAWWGADQEVQMPRWCWGIVAVALAIAAGWFAWAGMAVIRAISRL